MIDSNSLYVVDDNGEEKRMTILFTFDAPDGQKQYVVFQDPDGAEGEVFASAYTDDGQLIPIETEDEWDMVEEVINTFLNTEEETED
ncbi:DUF1292 domain-containing protein [Allobaculum mucilyticum]|uniref:DUF1292 domain-containing protein n=1 Tax=Allobaculum mucilyticum TaxID=2834459 RepID=UPI001E5B2283|nr:DUF1292 domain-containing protein [Allobaculum mucilyticum]UNT96389.1 DUF1292 domain-containing protein [Allobaculum mucilyticum]